MRAIRVLFGLGFKASPNRSKLVPLGRKLEDFVDHLMMGLDRVCRWTNALWLVKFGLAELAEFELNLVLVELLAKLGNISLKFAYDRPPNSVLLLARIFLII
jgi:hypothetical protein